VTRVTNDLYTRLAALQKPLNVSVIKHETCMNRKSYQNPVNCEYATVTGADTAISLLPPPVEKSPKPLAIVRRDSRVNQVR